MAYLRGWPHWPAEAAVDVDAASDVEAVDVGAIALQSIARSTQRAQMKFEVHLLRTVLRRWHHAPALERERARVLDDIFL